MREGIGKVESAEMRERIMQLTNPWIEAGKQQGRQQGEVELVLKLLARRVGSVSAGEKKAVLALPLEKVEALGEALLQFDSRADLTNWLRQNR